MPDVLPHAEELNERFPVITPGTVERWEADFIEDGLNKALAPRRRRADDAIAAFIYSVSIVQRDHTLQQVADWLDNVGLESEANDLRRLVDGA